MKITFKTSWRNEYGQRLKAWNAYENGRKTEIQICHISTGYAVGALDGWNYDYVGDYATLEEAKRAAAEYIRG